MTFMGVYSTSSVDNVWETREVNHGQGNTVHRSPALVRRPLGRSVPSGRSVDLLGLRRGVHRREGAR